MISEKSLGNISAPPEPLAGDITGFSPSRDISVLYEDLTIDLSEVIHQGLAKIRAHYKIRSPKTIRNLDLIFIANNLTESRYIVKYDKKFVNGYLTKPDTLPKGWFPPDSLPWKSGHIPFKYNDEGLIFFRLDSIAAGEHTLEVSYDADIAEWYEGNSLAIHRAFVYILKPADNTWKQFNSVNVNIFIPENWDFTSNLQLEKKGNSLHGYWKNVPDKYLTLVIKKGDTKARILIIVYQLVIWIFFLGLVIWCLKVVIKFRRDKNRKLTIKIMNIVFTSFISTLFFYFVYYTRFEILNYLLDNNLNPWVTYGTGYAVLGFPLIWIVSAAIISFLDFLLLKVIPGIK